MLGYTNQLVEIEAVALAGRVGQPIGAAEQELDVAVSAAISLAGTVWMARLAGTIYGRAILRTGSRLRVRQVLRSAS